MNKTAEFHYDCLGARSDMRSHGDGTGRNVENRACKMQTYGGGLRCCAHTFFLTDLRQDSHIPVEKDVYFFEVEILLSGVHSQREITLWQVTGSCFTGCFSLTQQSTTMRRTTPTMATNPSAASLQTSLLHTWDAILKICPTISPIVMTPHCHAPAVSGRALEQ